MWRKMVLLIGAVLALGLGGQTQGFEELLKGDIGTGDSAVEPGFVRINGGETLDVNGTGIDVFLDQTYQSGDDYYLGFRDNGFHDLYGDLVHVNDYSADIILTLGGLTPGVYTLETFLNRIWMDSSLPTNVDIYANGELVADDVPQSQTEVGPFASAVFVFTVPSGQSSAEIRFHPTGVGGPGTMWR